MKRRPLFLLVLLTGFALGAGPGPSYDWKYQYRLTKESLLEEGCFDPCECPIFMQDGLSGSMSLMADAPDGEYRVYRVTNVLWMVSLFGEDAWVRGEGVYRIGGKPLLQRMELDLRVGDRPIDHYDSGIVPVIADFPAIDVAVSRNGFYCHDTAFTIRAERLRGVWAPTDPEVPMGEDTPSLGPRKQTIIHWGTLKHLYGPER